MGLLLLAVVIVRQLLLAVGSLHSKFFHKEVIHIFIWITAIGISKHFLAALFQETFGWMLDKEDQQDNFADLNPVFQP